MEIFWLIIAIGTLILGLYAVFTDGFKENYMFMIMSLLSFLLYMARRNLRIKAENT